MEALTLAALQQFLPVLLRLYWILAAGSVIVTLLPVPVPKAFKDAVRLSACRGKLWHDKPAALGPLQDWSVPQAWFLHFYVVGSCCNAVMAGLYCLSLASTHSGGSSGSVLSATAAQPLLALLLFQLHLLRRVLETSLLLKYPRGAVMHGIAYLFGMTYYLVVPLSLVPGSWYQQQHWEQLLHHWREAPRQLQAFAAALPGAVSSTQMLGAAVFCTGNLVQFASHWGLAALSKGKAPRSEKTAYKIPRGGLFEYVSCPHYLGEIIIYLGLLLLTRGDLLPLLMLVWVGVNLVLAAGATHAWYLRTFQTYPSHRKALIPFVY